MADNLRDIRGRGGIKSEEFMDVKIGNVEGFVVVTLDGEIDLHNSPGLRKELQSIIKKQKSNLLINLQQVTYMDSSGLATLVEALQLLRKAGKKLGIFSLTDTVKNIFSITRLEEIFPIFATQKQAIEELNKK